MRDFTRGERVLLGPLERLRLGGKQAVCRLPRRRSQRLASRSTRGLRPSGLRLVPAPRLRLVLCGVAAAPPATGAGACSSGCGLCERVGSSHCSFGSRCWRLGQRSWRCGDQPRTGAKAEAALLQQAKMLVPGGRLRRHFSGKAASGAVAAEWLSAPQSCSSPVAEDGAGNPSSSSAAAAGKAERAAARRNDE